MEPKSSSPESAPGGAQNSPEHQPNMPDRYQEIPSFTPEKGEQSPAEREPTPQNTPPAQGPIPITLPQPVAPQADDDTQAQQTDDLPQTAGDEDLIEKEWVDKAKQIIAATRDDPHRREREVSRLQADYLKKRYGKKLGSS